MSATSVNAAQDGGGAADATSTVPAASTSKLTSERERRRLALRSTNLNVWQNGPTPPKGHLDSNMKKNTAFIKRVRQTLGAETKEQLVKEASTLNLDKYIEEIVQAIPEGLGKCTSTKDCLAAAESLSALHVRFSPDLFAVPLSVSLTSLLAMPSRTALQALAQEQREKDEALRVQRQKILFRAAAELALSELIRQDKGKTKAGGGDMQEQAPFPGQEWLFLMLRDMLANDREHTNVPILIALLKALGPTIVGASRSGDHGVGEVTEKLAATSLGEESVVSPDMQSRFRKLFEMYFSTLGKRIVKEHTRLQDQDRRNHEAYIRSGEIFEDRQQSYEKMTRSFEKMHDWGKSLSELLGLPLPALTSESKLSGVGLAVNLDFRPSGADRAEVEYAPGKSMWEDEDTRRFYEDLVDLQEMVPPTLLASGTKGKLEESTKERTIEDDAPSTAKGGGAESITASPPMKQSESPDANSTVTSAYKEAEDAGIGAGPAAQLNAFMAVLPEMSNRTMIDSAAVDFAFLNSKTARKRLVKQVASVPRNRSDLIPYYARLVATLNKYMPDVGQGVVALLDEEFRYLQKKRNVDLAESRNKNLRFIGELVKFRVTPLITTFHCFKVCLDDFNGPNVENIATLLETCGRFLLRNEETSERMRSTLELLRRKRAAQNLDTRQLVLLDNAYYQCNPPERDAIATKERSPMERYIYYLIYDVLARRTQDKVLKQLRKLDWTDSTARETLQNVFVRSWRIRFSNLHLLAVLLHDLQTYHLDFVVYVLDTVCEQIRSGMETNIFKDNQRRVATLKYLGELYNYRLINSDIIFEQLFSLVSFGHPYGRPLPGQVSPIDAPDDYFRIRLVCTLLDACGMCFDRGVLRKRLDDFLLFLNVYILSKNQPLPMDIDFMLSDTLEVLRPNFVLKRDFAEAAKEVDELLTVQQAAAEKKAIEVSQMGTMYENDDDESSSSTSSSDSSDASDEEAPRHVSKDDASTDSESSSSSSSSSTDSDDEGEGEEVHEEDGHARRTERSIVDQEAEDEFERELAKMMAEGNPSGQPGGAGRNQRGLFDIGLPFIKKANAASGQTSDLGSTAIAAAQSVSAAQADDVPPQHMRFSLLSKRGNRQQTHEVHVPMDAALAVHSRANEQQQLAERQQLKKLVLGIETREQADDRNNLESTLARRGLRIKPGKGDV